MTLEFVPLGRRKPAIRDKRTMSHELSDAELTFFGYQDREIESS
jgi:hypothetical protein